MFRKQQKITGTVLPDYYGNVTGVNIKKLRTYKNPGKAQKMRYSRTFPGSIRVHYIIVTNVSASETCHPEHPGINYHHL
jgi:hypothetical protein